MTAISISNQNCKVSPFQCLQDYFRTPANKGTSSNLKIGKSIFCMTKFRVSRHDACTKSHEKSSPSASFLDSKTREKLTAVDWPNEIVEVQSTIADGQQETHIKFLKKAVFYGTGEVAGSLERTGTRIVAWNTDAWGYGTSSLSLYQSHPWVFSLLEDGTSMGIMADTTKRCEIDLRDPSVIKFKAPEPFPVIAFGPHENPRDLLKALSASIGPCFMPPLWSLGYHQSRFSYEPDKKVIEVAETFRRKKIPCDVIWMDIDYMDGFRCFTFNPKSFPDPSLLSSNLHSLGFRGVWMLDPGIKEESGYAPFDSGCENDVWVLQADGKPYSGVVWPGPCYFPDFTSSSTRAWWAALITTFTLENGIDGIWNDMNEPSVFNSVTKTMPKSNIHRGDENLGGLQNHEYYHNVYGMLMARATFEGMLEAHPKRRPFVLTRAGFLGSQRYGATWTGDNLATWKHLQFSISMALNLSLSGQPFCGPDIGGFAGDCDPQLFGRWMGICSLFPFSRGHSEKGTQPHEPWAFGEECEVVCRMALERRYRLLPHLYTLMYLAHSTGISIMEPLFFHEPSNSALHYVEDSFLLGELLVATCTKQERFLSPSSDVLLPAGIWRRFHFNDTHPDLPLLFLKGGAIIPLSPVIQSTSFKKSKDPLFLYMALDEKGEAEGSLFEDNGHGFEFQHGAFLLSHYWAKLNDDGSFVTVTLKNVRGHLSRPERPLVVRLLLGEGAMVEKSGVDGQDVRIPYPCLEEERHIIALQKEQEFILYAKRAPLKANNTTEGGSDLKPKDSLQLINSTWNLTILPWLGGRIVSLFHRPGGSEHGGGYEEYSKSDYQSTGWNEPFKIVKLQLKATDACDSVSMEGDLGEGLKLSRKISIVEDLGTEAVEISSAISTEYLGAGSGGTSRVSCLRVHPSFQLVNPDETIVRFTNVRGELKEFYPSHGEIWFVGTDRPNGEWTLVDLVEGCSLVNTFRLEDVKKCFLYWGPGFCNLELFSSERPIAESSPLVVIHKYFTRKA